MGELTSVYVRSTQEGHTLTRAHTQAHAQGHTTLEALAVFRQGESGGMEDRDFSLYTLKFLKYVNSKGQKNFQKEPCIHE